MNLKLVVALCLFTAIPAVGYAQNSPPAPPPSSPPSPPPSIADVQKIVQMVSADKAKVQIYCQLGKLNDQIAEADQKNDSKAVETLGKQIDELEQKMGPDYVKLMTALDQSQLDPNSALGKQIVAAFDPLEKQCK
jgi:hypothetical protein